MNPTNTHPIKKMSTKSAHAIISQFMRIFRLSCDHSSLGRAVAWGALAASAFIAGCSDREVPPGPPADDDPAPSFGASSPTVDASVIDAGPRADGSAPSTTCREVVSGDLNNTANVLDSGGTNLGFSGNRVSAAWRAAPCSGPAQLELVLAENDCFAPGNSRLVFRVNQDDIGVQVIENLPVTVLESDVLDVEFILVRTGAAPQTFTNCLSAGGSVTFSDIDVLAGSRVRADFFLTLTDCDVDASTVTITGSTDATLNAAFEDVCVR